MTPRGRGAATALRNHRPIDIERGFVAIGQLTDSAAAMAGVAFRQTRLEKTPMHELDQSGRYSGISRLNHWLTALAVVAMWTLGLAAGEAPDAAEDYIIGIHIALGFFVLLFALWRIGWRLREGFQQPSADSRIERLAAGAMHRLLLLVLLVMVVTGPMYLFTEGEGMHVFGWFTFYIPMPLGHDVHEGIETVHKFCGEYLLPMLVGLHILAAARHWLSPRRAQQG